MPPADASTLIVVQRPLSRILAFTGFSIDDVVANPIAKNAVTGYYKLYKQIARRGEIRELEDQWSQRGRRGRDS